MKKIYFEILEKVKKFYRENRKGILSDCDQCDNCIVMCFEDYERIDEASIKKLMDNYNVIGCAQRIVFNEKIPYELREIFCREHLSQKQKYFGKVRIDCDCEEREKEFLWFINTLKKISESGELEIE